MRQNAGRTQQDGSIVYPHRGKPPSEIDGYIRDPGDEFRLIPEFPKCPELVNNSYSKPCPLGGVKWVTSFWCKKYQQNTSVTNCKECVDGGRSGIGNNKATC